MRNPYTPYVALVAIALFFGLLVWIDSPTAYTQDNPVILHKLTNQHVGVVSSHPGGFTELNGAVYFGIASEKGGLWKTDGTAQGPVLVKDVDVLPISLQRIGDFLYFIAQDDDYNSALWKSDGTAEGTILLKADLGIYPYRFAAIGAAFYFSASDPTHGRELWKSDGTPEGTTLVADLNPGQASTYPEQLVTANDVLYFRGYDEQFHYALWQSDGTAEGTGLVAEAPQNPDSLTVMQNTLYFAGYTETYGEELWRYAAGEQSPSLVSDIISGTQSAYIDHLLVVNDRLFFVAGYHELWQSDGTAGGTHLVKDVAPGVSWISLENFTAVDNLLYFRAYTYELGAELWKSDGTAEGTLLVKDIAPGADSSYPRGLTAMNGLLYFWAGASQAEDSLWQSDGTADGTVVVANLTFDESYSFLPAAIGNTLYFSAHDDEHGAELWISDGTSTGTTFVADLDPGYVGPQFSDFVRVNTRLYFTTYVYDPFGSWNKQLWLSDELTTTAILIEDALLYYRMQGAGDNLFISGYDHAGRGLWKHSGSAGAPELVKHFAREGPSNWIVLNDQLFFLASDNTDLNSQIYDLWRSDGTADGTIKLVEGTATTSPPTPELVFNGQLIATRDNEIWILDGTAEGITHFVPDGLLGPIRNIVSTPSALYFSSVHYPDTVNATYTLWRSDGTPEGTSQLTFDQQVGYISTLFPVDNTLYVLGYREGSGEQLWYHDGISQTVRHLTDLAYSYDYNNYGWMTPAGGQLFFTADDGEHGPEVWKSDGTPEGTGLIKDIIPAELATVPAAYPGPLFAFGDLLYFGANDGNTGQELWRSDGSADGTILFKDINPGAVGSSPVGFMGDAHLFYFSADDGAHGRELWQSDGTPEGTTLVTDLYVGSPSASPYSRLIFSDTLYFTGNNGLDGQQLFNVRTAVVPLALPIEEEPLPQQLLPQPHQLFLPLVNR